MAVPAACVWQFPPPEWHPAPLKCRCLPPLSAGTASQFVLMRAFGAVVGGLLGLICMYLTQVLLQSLPVAIVCRGCRLRRGQQRLHIRQCMQPRCSCAACFALPPPCTRRRAPNRSTPLQAANGGSYAYSTTKAAVMVTLLSCFSFCLGLLRFRFARWWFAFTVATFRCLRRRPPFAPA